MKLKLLHELLFPSLKDRRWGYVNFGEESYAMERRLRGGRWVESVHHNHGIEFSYGGYLEDRNNLWSGSYLKPGCAWHLGVDYAVPTDTYVHLPVDAQLVRAIMDPDQDGGWGGQVIVQVGGDAGTKVIFGHLKSLCPRPHMKAGEVIGQIAPREGNGNWEPHLHVQLVSDWLDATTVDGYSHLYEGIDKDFPRPESLLA